MENQWKTIGKPWENAGFMGFNDDFMGCMWPGVMKHGLLENSPN